VRIRLSFSSVATHFGPGLALLAVAGTVAAGGAGFFASIGSLFRSTAALAFAGAGLAALAVGCFLMRRELRHSGRARVVIGLIAGSAASVLVGTAALDRALFSGHLGVFVAPVNLLLAAGGLAWYAIAESFERDEHSEPTRIPKTCLGLAAPLWFAGWGAGNLAGPFTGLGTTPAIGVSLVLAMIATVVAGYIPALDPTVKLRLRRIGLGFLGLGAVAMAVWASAGAAGTLGSPGGWPGALLKTLGTLPAQIPRSGAPAILALGLLAFSDYALRGGLIRHYAKK
jgi:hypothetical protein